MRGGKWSAVRGAALGLALLISGGIARGDEVAGAGVGVAASGCGQSVTEEILGILLAAGNIDQAQYDALCRKARQEAEHADRVIAAAEAPPVASEGPTWDFGWSNGFKLKRSDDAFEFKFGGRLMADWASIWEDSDLRSTIGGGGFGTEVRRARLFFEGTLYERVFFKAQYDFANTGDGSTDIKDLYVGLKKLGPVGSFRVGHFKEPFQLQEQTSSKYISFLERSTLAVFDPGRNMGFMAENAVLDKKVLWQVGMFQDTNDQGFGFSNDDMYNVTARLVGVPLYSEDGDRALHLGFAYSHQFRNGDATLRYRERPETHLAQRFVDTRSPLDNDIPTDGIDLINPQLAFVWGPFALQSEYVQSWVSGDGVPDTDFWGAYGQVSYFLTGEHRSYELGKGRFGRVKPRRNFDPAEGAWGAWELAARYSYLDLNDSFVDGGKLSDVTAGINWYLFPNLRVMLNYVHSQLDDRDFDAANPSLDGDANIAQMRFQLDF